jgi:phosphohistidine phosphatase
MPTLPLRTIYLIRHGIAEERREDKDDASRALTPAGREKTLRVAQQLYHLGLRFEAIATSPLVRAQQTAEILAQSGLSPTLHTLESLAPQGCLAEALAWFDQYPDTTTLACVGHEPDLGQWALQLLSGAPPTPDAEALGPLELKKAGVIGLQVPAQQAIGHSRLFWLTPPRLLLG